MRTRFLLAVMALLVLSLPTVAGAAEPNELVLADNGQSDYQVVIPDSYPSELVGNLVGELGELVRRAFAANGAELAVVAESRRDPARPAIFLGDTGFARAHGVDPAGFKGWAYAHKAVGRDLVVAGRDAPNPGVQGAHLGTAKGVADFLRAYAGTRFLYPGGDTGLEFLPAPVISVPADLDARVEPALRYNAPGGYYQHRGVVSLADALYLVANNFFPISGINYQAHAYNYAVPAARYGESHPEYFALIGGSRTPGNHLCVSNPGVQALIYQWTLATLDLGYEATTLSQQDGFRPCQCGECHALYDTGADWGAKLWEFHRRLAERLLADRPGKRLILSAYGPTLQPPESFRAFPENVGVELCLYTESRPLFDVWRPLEVPGKYHAFLYLFGRRSGMGYNPQNTPLRVEGIVRDYHAYGIHSIYMDGFGQGFGIDGPTYYVLGRMWDDPQNNRAGPLVEEYLDAAFRESAEPMRLFFQALYNALELYVRTAGHQDLPGRFTDLFGRERRLIPPGDPMRTMRIVYPASVLEALETQLSRAEGMAGGEKVKRRLALVRLEFDHLRRMAEVAHLEEACRINPDHASRDALLQALTRWHAYLDTVFEREGAMKREPIPGWPEHRPFRGYTRDLIANWRIYQDTPLAWDLETVRRAPLPGARKLNAKRAQAPGSALAPAWATAETAALLPASAGDGHDADPGAPLLRAAFDDTRLYLRLDAAEAAGRVAAWEIVLDPFGDRTRYFRFTAGPDGQARRETAFGFIADSVHPLYGREDDAWSGAWDLETGRAPATGRRFALFAIPFRTLGVAPPAPGALWRGNAGVALETPGAGSPAQWLWSRGPESRETTDRNHFGELRFTGDGP